MDTNKYGNQDEKEKSRALSPAEQKRLEEFEKLSDSMIEKGYKRVDLTISIVKANIFAIILLIPLFIIGIGAFVLCNKDAVSFSQSPLEFIIFVLSFVAAIFVHEGIHGLTWSFFTPHGFKDIEFGFMKQYLTPYCTCKAPLQKSQYILGAIMPFLVLGVLPMIIGVVRNSWLTLFFGIIMADSAAGDLMIIYNLLRYKTSAEELVYMDHPTQGGGVIFEK
ncbi:MAG: DUF3267 domain-containing protein [Faecalicoccus sp.]|nr:DUF3267 domain-containing protein [Faecalicoccus sp.]